MNPTLDGELNQRLVSLLAKEYAVREASGERADALQEAAASLLDSFRSKAEATKDRFRYAIESLSDNRNTVVYDDSGLPSIMVRIRPIREKDVTDQGSDALHPAFTSEGQEILIGKYQSSIVDGRACSLPLAEPAYGVDLDAAMQYCSQKGNGYYLTPFALRMAIALQCRRQGFLPRGNSHNGKNYLFPDEKGILVAGGERVLCGSGPVTWAHDGTPDGIYDLNGNLNEWSSGFRLMDGEIQVIPTADLLTPDADISVQSPLWKAIDQAGGLVVPGSPGTLKYDAKDGGVRLTRSVDYAGIGNCAFHDIQIEEGFTPPDITRLLGLCPENDRSGYGHGWRWIQTSGEGMPLCGGASRADDHSGIFFVGATYPRTKNYSLTGFRLMYWNGGTAT